MKPTLGFAAQADPPTNNMVRVVDIIIEIKADTDEQSDNVSIEDLKEKENTNIEKSDDDSINNQ